MLLDNGLEGVYNRHFGPWRSLASALAWGARGPEFKSRRPDHVFNSLRKFDPSFIPHYPAISRTSLREATLGPFFSCFPKSRSCTRSTACSRRVKATTV